jgi:two-component system, chemotaxis family, protein-glutamate methylesterase/glutaminase
MTPLIRTVIVDDSAFVRKVVREILSSCPFIEVVGMARNGADALEMVEDLKPDVVTCDLLMPGMNGVEFVRRQMERRPVPILILTASPEDGDAVLQALDAGAVDLVKKPNALATEELLVIRDELIEKVKAAAKAPPEKLRPLAARADTAAPPRIPTNAEIVVIGLSTGGPQALRYLLPQIPADFPVPIAIVLHMPVGYTAMFAEKLNEITKVTVKEANEGDALRPGEVYLGRAGKHFVLGRTAAGNVLTRLISHPLDKPHRPSVDVLFQSAAEVYRSRVLAVVMTGMGDDGKQGAAWVKAQGGKVLTEAEQSCVIYGMPRVVVEAGLSDASYPLQGMAAGISEHL